MENNGLHVDCLVEQRVCKQLWNTQIPTSCDYLRWQDFVNNDIII